LYPFSQLAGRGVVAGRAKAQGQTFKFLRRLLGKDGGEAMQEIVRNASLEKSSTHWAAIGCAALMLFGASMVFVQLQSLLNVVGSHVRLPPIP
jgi:hypothetical protein